MKAKRSFLFIPYGDLNGDGSVNIADITALIDCIIEHDQDLNYDFDEDGSVGIADVTSLIDYILQGANLSSLAVARALLAAPRQLQASLHCARLAQEFPPQLP